MTRTELEWVRAALDGAGRVLQANIDYRGGAYMECGAPEALSDAIRALAVLDAELAKPEALEAMLERLKLGAAVVNVTEIEGETEL